MHAIQQHKEPLFLEKYQLRAVFVEIGKNIAIRIEQRSVVVSMMICMKRLLRK